MTLITQGFLALATNSQLGFANKTGKTMALERLHP
jgi:hypothetical protein